ncbi:DNA cytosine methyltransferase [Fibrella aestuarina]|nr:DNA cytosine methyltransferase [Fibrella aestuarina]
MAKPKLLDLFCCAGGAGMGFHRAGFEVVGIDRSPQPRYPFRFIQADALQYLADNWKNFNAFHASPPCQRYSVLTPTEHQDKHPDLIGPTRDLLLATGKPYDIENVPGARHELHNPIMLCGSMFGLKTHRHRFFEIGFDVLIMTPACKHDFIPTVVSGTTKRLENGKRREHTVAECRAAMDIDWMIRKELDQAIPPAYTEYIGNHMIEYLR